MLAWMRKFVRSKAALGLFALLIVSFGILYKDPFQGISGGGFVRVGDREILPRDLNKEVEQQLERIREEEKQVISPREAAQRGLTNQVFQSLLYRNSVLAFADKIGVKASASAVTNLISSAPAFKDALGRLNMDALKRYAQEKGQTVAQFEADLRDQMTFGYMQEAAFGGITTPEVLLKPLVSYYGEQRTISIARIPPNAIPAPKTPSTEELRTYYTQNSDRFREPERRRISVLSYSKGDFLDKVELNDAQIKSEYDRRIKEFSGPESREIFQFTGKDRNTVQSFVDSVKSGSSLEDALKKTPGVTRIDLTVKPGDLTDKDYNAAVFALPAGQLVGPSKVGQAFYAVQVKTITPGTPTPLAQVSETISNQIRDTEADRLFNKSEESFLDMAGGTALEEIGRNIGAPTIELAPVNAQGVTADGKQSSLLAANPDAARSLFSLTAGQMTDVIEKDKERMIFRVDEVIPTHTPKLEDVEAKVTKAWQAQKVQEAADKIANDLVAVVKSGQVFATAAKNLKMAALPDVTLNRAQQPPISPTVAQASFNLKQGDVAVIKGEGGEPFVVKVDSVQPVNPATAAQIHSQIAQQISQSLQSDIQEVFIRGVQAEVKPNINEAAIKKYFDNLTKEEGQ